MIRRFEVEDIAKIMNFEHDIEVILPMILDSTKEIKDKGEWIQWLVSIAETDEYLVAGEIEDGAVKGYLVVRNTVRGKIKSTWVYYTATTGSVGNNKQLRDMMIEWSKKCGATSIEFITQPKNVIGYAQYGFKTKATLMSMEI